MVPAGSTKMIGDTGLQSTALMGSHAARPAPLETVAGPHVRQIPMVATLIVYFLALTTVMTVIGTTQSAGSMFWFAAVSAIGLYMAAFALVLAPAPGRLRLVRAATAMCLAIVAQGLCWISISVDSTVVIRGYAPLLATAFVVEVVLITRNRIATAWIGTVTGIVLSVSFSRALDATDWWSPVESLNLLSVIAASAGAFALSPFLGSIDAFAARGRRVADVQSARLAADHARDERIARIELHMSDLLADIVESDAVTEAHVAKARLFEAQLRDGIRAPALDNGQTRRAVWAARARGVSVTLLDDGAFNDLPLDIVRAFLSRMVPKLITELEGLNSGELIARIAPPGRVPVASITVAPDARRRRIEFGLDGRVSKVVWT